MGANAATKCYKVVENLQRILAIELFNASQALDFRRPLKSSVLIEKIMLDYRKKVDFVSFDKIMFTEIEKSVQFLKNTFSISEVN
jgi:histidine ammonia-lyase